MSKLTGLRERIMPWFANAGMRRKHVVELPDDVRVLPNRRDLRAAGRRPQRYYEPRRSPKMRHGIDANPRKSVEARRLRRIAERDAAMAQHPSNAGR